MLFSLRKNRVVPICLCFWAMAASVFAVDGSDLSVAAAPTVPVRTAILRSEPEAPVRAQLVDWSGYRGIRRYSPYYYPAYAGYSPYYYGNYAYRPWYARPYAYAYGYPAFAPPVYAPRGWYRGYYGYNGYAPYAAPYAWGGFYPPVVSPSVLVSPQVSWTAPAASADYVGCFYW
ncbi:MAG: hypothetical protein WD875_02350 [Pirellulales bacterium]